MIEMSSLRVFIGFSGRPRPENPTFIVKEAYLPPWMRFCVIMLPLSTNRGA